MKKNPRWLYLIIGIFSMLFAGVIYAWSILKTPLEATFGWSASALALNFTLTMCFFCIGGVLASRIQKRIGFKVTSVLAGILAGAGFCLTAALDGTSISLLYLTYGFLAGLGIGMAYNIVVSIVGLWFPDKKGLCSGCLMMGFGASTLILGNLSSSFILLLGWRKTYVILGIAIGAVIIIATLLIKRPGSNIVLPQAKLLGASKKESFEVQDYTTVQMIRRFSFWRAFICLVFLSAVGNTVISFARDLTLSVGASATLATTLVGILSICNGLGRIATGAVFDAAGRRVTMIVANLLTILAAAVTLAAIFAASLPLCVIGLCLTGLSYGSSPTLTSAFTSAFYGTKYFAQNFSIMNFNIMVASFVATIASILLTRFNGYSAPFILLLILAILALFLNLSIKRP